MIVLFSTFINDVFSILELLHKTCLYDYLLNLYSGGIQYNIFIDITLRSAIGPNMPERLLRPECERRVVIIST